MKAICWFAAKPGEERRYASPREFSPEHAAVLRRDGYMILAVNFNMPPEFDPADHNVRGRAKREECK